MKKAGCVWVLAAALVGVRLNGRIEGTQTAQQVRQGTVSVDGVELPYYIEGEGIPCLVINNALAMRRALSQDLRKTFRFIFSDMRAMVPYTKTYDLEKVTLDTFLDDIERVRAAVGFDKVCVFGHSIGGLFALEYARKYPQHVTHVIMNGTPPYATQKMYDLQETFWGSHASEDRKVALKKNQERMKESIGKEPPGRTRIAAYIMNGPMYFYDPRYDCAWLFEGEHWSPELFERIFGVIMKSYDIADRKVPDVPIFLSLGRHDYAVPFVCWDGIKEKIPNLSYNLFDKSGHYAPLEERELFDKKLIGWIKSH